MNGFYQVSFNQGLALRTSQVHGHWHLSPHGAWFIIMNGRLWPDYQHTGNSKYVLNFPLIVLHHGVHYGEVRIQ